MYTTRINLPILERVHKLISNYCRENVCCYTDSEKIRELCSYKAGLQNTCYYIVNRNIRKKKSKLADNLIINLNRFFL